MPRFFPQLAAATLWVRESFHDWWLAEILLEVPNMSGNWRLVNYDLQSPKLTVCTYQEAFPKGKDPLQNQFFFRCYVGFNGGEFTCMISLKFLQVVSWFTSSLAKASLGLVIQLISTYRCLSGSMVVFIRWKPPSISSSPWELQTINGTQENCQRNTCEIWNSMIKLKQPHDVLGTHYFTCFTDPCWYHDLESVVNLKSVNFWCLFFGC